MRVQMFTTTFCGYCVRAKLLLASRAIPYEEINLSGDRDRRTELVRATRWKTVPQIFIDGEFIGGFHELVALDRSGELARRLGAAPQNA